jgi:acetate kinase
MASNIATHILTINTGSSSLKASLFKPNGLQIKYQYNFSHNATKENFILAFDGLLKKFKNEAPQAIGHRFVHGGDIVDDARILDSIEIDRLKSISNLAPLHMPQNIFGVEYLAKHYDAPQIACFDTAFHATLPELAWRLPIPNSFKLRRYGFHGINYSYIARKLPELIGNVAMKSIVVAHLGSGASLCLMRELKSIDTTMGLSPAGGIAMATRSGDLDPGVMLELAKSLNQSQLTDLVYHQMGLLALSNNESSDISQLIKSKSDNAQFATQYFANQVRGAIGAYAGKVGGVDAIVFTGGISEHCPEILKLICDPLKFLQFSLGLNTIKNQTYFLNNEESKPILLIPADEESEIARLAGNLLSSFNSTKAN